MAKKMTVMQLGPIEVCCKGIIQQEKGPPHRIKGHVHPLICGRDGVVVEMSADEWHSRDDIQKAIDSKAAKK